MLGVHPSIDLPQSTEYAKEMRKWESLPTKWGNPGHPYQFHEFPKMLYKAGYESGKGIHVVESRTVNDADEERNMLSRGFHFGQDAAYEAAQREQTEHGKLAAELNYEARHMSAKAQAEINAAQEAAGARHLPSVPETPIRKRRAYTRKVKPTVPASDAVAASE